MNTGGTMSDNKQIAVQTDPNSGVSLQQMERAAAAMAASGFYGIKTKEEGLALMLVAQADGIHFAAGVRDYHIISGRPAMKADAMLARFQRAGGSVKWLKLDDAEVSAEFTHPQGGSAVITWDDARVAQAELRSPMHKKYPRQMKRSRVISEGIRTVFPGVVSGTYSIEEVQDIAFEEQGGGRAAIDAAVHKDLAPIGRAEDTSGTGLTDSEIEDHTNAIEGAADAESLRASFKTAWKHATEAKDATAKAFFKRIYDERKLAKGWA
jgi:hypothetical protein